MNACRAVNKTSSFLCKSRLSPLHFGQHVSTRERKKSGSQVRATRRKARSTSLRSMVSHRNLWAYVPLTTILASLVLFAEPAQALDFSGIIGSIGDVAKDLGPLWGAVLFTVAYVMSTILLIPGSILTLAAGALFGPVKGTVVVSVASTLGAVAAFLIARYLAQPWVEDRLRGNTKLQAVISSISAEGQKLVLLLRLSPVFPFAILNYALGLTTITLGDYTTATWAGMLPATFAYVYLGDVGRSAADAAKSGQGFSPEQIALWVLGAGATILATKVVSSAAAKALKDAENRQQQQAQQPQQQQQDEQAR